MDYLARLQTDGEAGMPELNTMVQRGQVTVVVTPAMEAGLASILSQLSGQATRTVAVLLEDFVPDESSDMPFSGWNMANLEVIRCSKGNLPAVMEKLGNSLSRELTTSVD
jgi:hypothetical protein